MKCCVYLTSCLCWLCDSKQSSLTFVWITESITRKFTVAGEKDFDDRYIVTSIIHLWNLIRWRTLNAYLLYSETVSPLLRLDLWLPVIVQFTSNKQKMRAKFLVVFLVNSLLVVSGSNVVELNLKNFDEYVDGERFVFVFFYASWQDQCQKILERYDEVANAFDRRDDVVIAKVNAYEEIKLATKYWVDRYPAFRYFIKGSVTEET